jgi:hypothetical protein
MDAWTMKKKIVLFLDCDGVFSIYCGGPRDSWFGEIKRTVWPIPNGQLLLQCIAEDTRLHPVWLSAWGDDAMIWNVWARTRFFPVAYHLSERQECLARKFFPHYYDANVDSKLIAANYYLRQHPGADVVWIEDEFAPETVAWSRKEDWCATYDHPLSSKQIQDHYHALVRAPELGSITLLDANADEVGSLLLSEDKLYARELLCRILESKSDA